MRRRLARLAMFMLVLPLGIKGVEALADRLEAAKGPTTASRLLREGSSIGRQVVRHGRR